MSPIALQLEYSVDLALSPEFAWNFRTDVATWNDPPAQFTLEGPFQAGARGTTQLPGQDPIHWRITAVDPGKSFVLEMPLDRAVLAFEWSFDPLPEDKTKMTQRIILSGDNAQAYAQQVEAGFRRNLADGMERVSRDMEAAAKKPQHVE